MSSISMFPTKWIKPGWVLTGREAPRAGITVEQQIPVPGDMHADPDTYFRNLTTICDGAILMNLGFIYVSLEDYDFIQQKMPALLQVMSVETAKEIACPICGQLLPDAYWCAKCGPIKGGTNDNKSVSSP